MRSVLRKALGGDPSSAERRAEAKFRSQFTVEFEQYGSEVRGRVYKNGTTLSSFSALYGKTEADVVEQAKDLVSRLWERDNPEPKKVHRL